MSKSELWKERIQSWRQTGMTQRGWCAKNNVPIGAFRYWLYKLISEERSQEAEAAGCGDMQAEDNEFYELASFAQHAAPENESNALSIRYKDFTVVVPENASRQAFSMVMEVLANA